MKSSCTLTNLREPVGFNKIVYENVIKKKVKNQKFPNSENAGVNFFQNEIW